MARNETIPAVQIQDGNSESNPPESPVRRAVLTRLMIDLNHFMLMALSVTAMASSAFLLPTVTVRPPVPKEPRRVIIVLRQRCQIPIGRWV